ncbi:MAG: LptF/LptG family permease [Acidobacteria bacterium]|nr:LptF/LptG family permease [Acidobacteriota bacterium]
MRGWTRLDRYMTRELWGPLVLALSGFTMLLLLTPLFEVARLTIEKRVPLSLVLGYLVAAVPGLLVISIPMSVLVGVLVGVGRMAAQSELIALRSSGVGRARLGWPVLLFALTGTAAGLVTAHYLVPLGMQHRRELTTEVLLSRDPGREIDPQVFYDRLPGTVLYAASAADSPEGRVFEGIFLQRETNDGMSDVIAARRGRPIYDAHTGRVSLLLDDVEWHTWRTGDPATYHRILPAQYTLTFPPDPAMIAFERPRHENPTEAVGPDLPRLITELRQQREGATRGKGIAADRRIRKARLEWHRRWALPMAAAALAAVAFPLAARSRRGGRFAGLTQSLLVIVAFWALFTTGLGLSDQGTWPVWLGPWLPVLLTLAWAALLWATFAARERGRLTFLPRLALALPRPRRAPRPKPPGAAPDTARWASRTRRVPRFGVTRFDAYVGSAFFRMFLAVLLVLAVLGLAVEFLGVIDEVDPAADSFPWGSALAYTGLSLPGRLKLLLPIAALAASSIALAGLARGGEIIAFKASGIGVFRIAAPLLALGLGLSAVEAMVQETLTPVAERESRRALDAVQGRSSTGESESGRRWIAGDDGTMWAYLDIDAQRSTLMMPGLVKLDLASGRILEHIEAQAATYSGGRWVFHKGWRRVFSADGSESFERFREHVSQHAESPELFGATRTGFLFGRRLAEQMSFNELRRHLQRVTRAGYNAAPLVVGMYEKIVSPLLSMVLLLVGIPFMVTGWRGHGGLYGFGLSLLIAFVFWSLWATSMSFGRDGWISPGLAVAGPPILVVVLGCWLLARAR